MESVDITHSSRKAWQTINKMTRRSMRHSRYPVSANVIAPQLLNNERVPDADRDFARWTSRGVTSLSRAATADANLSSDFTVEVLEAAIKKMKSGKAPGRDIHTDFVMHQSAKTTTPGYMFVLHVVFPKIQVPKRPGAVLYLFALPKSNKPSQDPKSYRHISLLCVPFKSLERLLLSRIDPVVEPQLLREQAGFRRHRSTVDQVTLLTQYIEDSFQHNEKAMIVFVDLTAAYATVGHRGLHLKLLRTIPDRHMVGFIMDIPELRIVHKRRTAQ